MATKPPVERLTPTTLVDEIAYRLQRAILEGEYRFGTHLSQDEICARFGVSRTPVREALRKLQAQHLVVLTPNKGATVRIPSRSELEDTYTVRVELEGFAAQLAAQTDGAETARKLDTLQGQIDALQAEFTDDVSGIDDETAVGARFGAADIAWHAAVFDGSNNAQLARICHELEALVPKEYIWRATHSSDEWLALLDDHRAVSSAIGAGRPEEARAAMAQHIRHAGQVLVSHLADNGFWD
jgi:DNA-binding GntR family transcriptional regulator